MAAGRDKASEQAILLGLLDAVERGDVTQRRLSSELGIAVGLVNLYIKRCINKGLIKVKQVPPRRYAYYLTPKGFLEKSHLVANYFIRSFDFFRRARSSCQEVLANAAAAGHHRLALIGASELTEIAIMVATEIDVKIVAVIDPERAGEQFLNIPIQAAVTDVPAGVDAVVITTLADPQAAFDAAVKNSGADRVHVPEVLADMIVRFGTSQQQRRAGQ
jgi:predicted transcriptional regulator